MIFNSLEFLIFLPIVFIVYWFFFQGNRKTQNAFLVLASYVFYGWWDWRFLSLIIFSSFLDFILGKKIYNSTSKVSRKLFLRISLIVNLGLLGVFKYFNFFVDSFVSAFNTTGIELNTWTLNIILPVGISFYTFQTLSYTLDIYKKRLVPTFDPISFFAFVSFFPQLVAGPIERASSLLPQFEKKRTFDYALATDGLGQIVWGMFKKVVIADSCAPFVDNIFEGYTDFSSPVLILGVVLFSIQLYADFSGYSDIAIGTARLFGFKLMQNFAFPYFSVNMTEFWRRWHISLSTWIRDYVYSPLSLRLRHHDKRYNYIIAFVTTFTLFGFWHGANWTFVVWGIFHGVVLSYEHRTRKIRKLIKAKFNDIFYYLLSVFFTYCYWCFSCILFRAESINHGIDYLVALTSFNAGNSIAIPKLIPVFIALLFFVEWIQKEKAHGLYLDNGKSVIFKWGLYYFFAMITIIFYKDTAASFIYFQF